MAADDDGVTGLWLAGLCHREKTAFMDEEHASNLLMHIFIACKHNTQPESTACGLLSVTNERFNYTFINEYSMSVSEKTRVRCICSFHSFLCLK